MKQKSRVSGGLVCSALRVAQASCLLLFKCRVSGGLVCSALLVAGLLAPWRVTAAARRTTQTVKKADVLTAEEKNEIFRSDGRNRIKAYFRVTQKRLEGVRALVSKEDYKEASRAIDECSQIYDDAFEFINATPGAKKKRDPLWKQMERGLQDQISFMESLQRNFPFEFSEPSRQLVAHSKDLRIRCLSALFGPNILKNPYVDDDAAPAKKKDHDQ